ncbi:NAD(P)-dependent oxidoreductase [Xanthovirga aplysinae]|uniref:NAD(P)-dependent oxidoreductase n=1 Tax=Xanthovirga aplysinae TaxID=2529853 RepID=UPI0012BBFA08|nr:NAD(P)-dependent oxidoreductase [Xanthovirga aplysinae]MTI33145.1 dihydrofolate reductase [Xanthovirga aplysinae]
MFNKIVVVDQTGLQDWAIEELGKFSVNGIINHNDFPNSEEEIINRIQDAECVLVSWHTQVTKKVIGACENLKYIGMCCSLYDDQSSNVDIAFAKKRNITVKGIRDYGDEGLVEYILSELIRLNKGIGKYQWKQEPVELTNRKLGIIGFGTTGRMLAERAKAFQMNVYYFNRSRKEEAEQNGVKFLPLHQLLNEVEIISLHLPKGTQLLKEKEFKEFGNGKILINTSLGLTFDELAFKKWITTEGNFALLDGDGIGGYGEEFSTYERIISTNLVSGWTKEAKERLSRKVIENIEAFLEEISF